MTVDAQRNLDDAQTYATKLLNELKKILDELETICDINGRPNTYYETLEEALKHKSNLAALEKNLELKTTEFNPYDEQIEELQKTAIQEISWDTVNSLVKLREHQEFLLK